MKNTNKITKGDPTMDLIGSGMILSKELPLIYLLVDVLFSLHLPFEIFQRFSKSN